MTGSGRWLVFLLVLCPASVVGALAQDGAAGSASDREAQQEELDAASLAEIERLRDELERLLSTVPPSLHDRVRELLLTSPGPAQGEGHEVLGTPSQVPGTPISDPPVVEQALADGAEAEPGAAPDPAPPVTPTEEPEPIAEPAIEPSKQQGPNPLARRQSRRAACNTLDPLDENGDGKVNAQDRYWRYLYVWVDQNRDGRRQDKEVQSAYAAGVREIETGLGGFYRKKGGLGEIRRGEALLFDLAGNGFGGGRRPDDGVLMVDADGLGRGDGPKVLDASGAAVQGIEPFEAGWQVRLADGKILAINCP